MNSNQLSKNHQNSLSIVVPVYNEVECVPRLYDALKPVMQKMGREYEILLVDDGSRDGSWEVLEQLAAQTSESR